jgi:hypothetical protein
VSYQDSVSGSLATSDGSLCIGPNWRRTM